MRKQEMAGVFYTGVFKIRKEFSFSKQLIMKGNSSSRLSVLILFKFISKFISPVVWNMCENLHCDSVYFKELHNEQEYYWLTVYRTGEAVVSTITSLLLKRYDDE